MKLRGVCAGAIQPRAYVLIGDARSELGQTNDGVVGGLQVGEVLAQEGLQPGHVGPGQVVGRREGLRSDSQAEQEHP